MPKFRPIGATEDPRSYCQERATAVFKPDKSDRRKKVKSEPKPEFEPESMAVSSTVSVPPRSKEKGEIK